MLAEMAQAKGGDFCIIRTHKTEPQRTWPDLTGPFSQIILPGIRLPLGENRAIAVTSSPVRHLARFTPDIVILAGFGLAMWQAHRWCRAHNIAYIIRFDGWARSDAVFVNPMRAKMRQIMIKHASGAMAASQPGKNWFLTHGMATGKIALVPIASSFAPLPDNTLPGFNQRPYDLLWCGRPTKPKGFDHFLSLAAALYRQNAISRICIVGVPAHDNAILQAKLLHAGLCPITTVLPPVPPHHLAALYASARLFLLPSLSDAYGVAVVEAITCQAIALASDQVGVAHDVLVAGETMLPLPDQGLNNWLGPVKRLLTDPAYRDRHLSLQKQAARTITPHLIAQHTWHACQTAIA
jgi:glycosyltransferase involved in cell wall biosynthesis